MLILSRRADESIVIGDEVVITILSVKGKQVRVGITAPPDISVHREEIYQRIQSGELDADSDTVPGPGIAAAPRRGKAAEDAATTEIPADGNVAPADYSIDDDVGNH